METKKDIRYFFAAGLRCNSTQFLAKYNLRKMASPFDWVIIDFNTTLKLINNKCKNLLTDLVIVNKNNKYIELIYPGDSLSINDNIYKLLNMELCYTSLDLNSYNLIINQNFLDDDIITGNLYEWKSICEFHHHDKICDTNFYNNILKRVKRFNHIIDTYPEYTAIFFITKIIDDENIDDCMNEIINNKKINNNKNIIIIIICSSILDEKYYFLDDCLFIVKKVHNYGYQIATHKTYLENNTFDYNYDKEYEIILKYFNLKLTEKSDTDIDIIIQNTVY